MNYADLLVGADTVKPQVHRVQGITNSKVATNVSELCNFLGLCNYFHQSIENYADLAKSLTKLLKKDTPFVWDKPQERAMQALKDKLCTTLCMAYLDSTQPFHLGVGFSEHCLRVGLY